jgi:hypothetical protein
MNLMIAMRSCALVSLLSLVIGQLIVMAPRDTSGGDFSGAGEVGLAIFIMLMTLVCAVIPWLAAIILHWILLRRKRDANNSSSAMLINWLLLSAPPAELALFMLINIALHGR